MRVAIFLVVLLGAVRAEAEPVDRLLDQLVREAAAVTSLEVEYEQVSTIEFVAYRTTQHVVAVVQILNDRGRMKTRRDATMRATHACKRAGCVLPDPVVQQFVEIGDGESHVMYVVGERVAVRQPFTGIDVSNPLLAAAALRQDWNRLAFAFAKPAQQVVGGKPVHAFTIDAPDVRNTFLIAPSGLLVGHIASGPRFRSSSTTRRIALGKRIAEARFRLPPGIAVR
jgi:hypothetical protein